MVLWRRGATAFVLLLALADAALADLATGFVAQPATELAAPAAGSPAASKRSEADAAKCGFLKHVTMFFQDGVPESSLLDYVRILL